MREIQSCGATTPVEFATVIAPAARPAVLRAIVADWPLVAEGDPAAHIPAEVAGILGPVTAETIVQMRSSLAEALNALGVK